MGASCKGICLEFKQDRIPNAKKYQYGLNVVVGVTYGLEPQKFAVLAVNDTAN